MRKTDLQKPGQHEGIRGQCGRQRSHDTHFVTHEMIRYKRTRTRELITEDKIHWRRCEISAFAMNTLQALAGRFNTAAAVLVLDPVIDIHF